MLIKNIKIICNHVALNNIKSVLVSIILKVNGQEKTVVAKNKKNAERVKLKKSLKAY